MARGLCAAWLAFASACGCRTDRATAPPREEPDAGPPAPRRMFIGASVANVRQKPEKTAALVTKLRIATPVEAVVHGEWAQVTSHGRTGWVLSALLEPEQPTVPKLLERFDRADAGEVAERRKWAERATALDAQSAPAFERLVAALEQANDERGLTRAREHLAGLNSAALVATAGGTYQLLPKAPAGALSQLYGVLPVDNRLWVATGAGLVTRPVQKAAWTAPFDSEGRPLPAPRAVDAYGIMLWGGTPRGLMRLDPSRSEWLLLGKAQGLASDQVDLVEVGPRTVWAAHLDADELSEVTIDGTKARQVLLPDQDPSNRPMAMMLDGDWLWVACAQAVYRVTASTGAVEVMALPDWQPGQERMKWVATDAGVSLLGTVGAWTLAPDGGAWTHSAVDEISPPSDLIWVGASYDVVDSSPVVRQYLMDASDGWRTAFYFNADTLSIFQSARAGSTVWIASTRGLLSWETGSDTVTTHRLAAKKDGTLVAQPKRQTLSTADSSKSPLLE